MPDPSAVSRLDNLLTDIEMVLQKHLPARDSRIWQISFWGGLVVFVANHPNLLPPGMEMQPQWQKWLIDISAAAMAMGGKFGWSSAKAPEKPENQTPQP